MAKDNSFDIVSRVDLQEVDNAIQQTSHEIAQRYDLKNAGATVTLDKSAPAVTLTAPDDFTLKQVLDVLGTKLVKRGVDLKALPWGQTEAAASGTVRKTTSVVNGIDPDLARKINKDIRAEKFKVKVQIEGDQLRVSGAKRDILQEVIAFVKERDYGIPLQFVNYR